jgi:post-segregation antitoxin (ccd killing protein)
LRNNKKDAYVDVSKEKGEFAIRREEEMKRAGVWERMVREAIARFILVPSFHS